MTEYYEMAKAGILTEDDRVELIDGEIIEMTPIGPRHAVCVRRLNELFRERLGKNVLVDSQNPVRLGEHAEPQPDLVLLRPRTDLYSSGHPIPEDVLLVIEVAETSADWDRRVKAPLYAKAGIPELWRVDLRRDTITVSQEPTPNGYRVSRIFRRGEMIAPAAFPNFELSADQILGTTRGSGSRPRSKRVHS